MVLATKRAAGSEYDYPSYPNSYERHSPTRRQRVSTRAKRKSSPMVGIVVLTLFFTIGLSYTFLQATKAHLNWQISKAEENVAALHMDNEKLRLEVAELSSLGRIESIASTQLQMVKPPKVEYLAFQDGLTVHKGLDLLTTPAKNGAATLQADSAENETILGKIVAAIKQGINGDGSDGRWSEEIVSTY